MLSVHLYTCLCPQMICPFPGIWRLSFLDLNQGEILELLNADIIQEYLRVLYNLYGNLEILLKMSKAQYKYLEELVRWNILNEFPPRLSLLEWFPSLLKFKKLRVQIQYRKIQFNHIIFFTFIITIDSLSQVLIVKHENHVFEIFFFCYLKSITKFSRFAPY